MKTRKDSSATINKCARGYVVIFDYPASGVMLASETHYAFDKIEDAFAFIRERIGDE